MSSAPTDCRVPDPSDKLDAKADGQFQQVNRRAGYGDDRLDRIIATARKGWTLAAGEGLVLVQEIDRLRKGKEIVTSMLFDQTPLLNRMQDTLDLLREPSEAVKDAVFLAVIDWYPGAYDHRNSADFSDEITSGLNAAVAAAEREVAGDR